MPSNGASPAPFHPAVFGPIFGKLSDRIGQRNTVMIGTIISILAGYILFQDLIHHGAGMPWIFAIGMGIAVAIVNGSYGAAIAEQFSTSMRYTGMGLSYNLGFAIFGGLAPLILTLLIKFSGHAIAPYYYLFACALLTLIAAISLPSTIEAVI